MSLKWRTVSVTLSKEIFGDGIEHLVNQKRGLTLNYRIYIGYNMTFEELCPRYSTHIQWTVYRVLFTIPSSNDGLIYKMSTLWFGSVVTFLVLSFVKFCSLKSVEEY